MERLLKKYRDKLVAARLSQPGELLFGAMDDELCFVGGETQKEGELARLFSLLSINTALFARPLEPYGTIIDYLAEEAQEGVVRPQDTETRTFLHELPVVDQFDAVAMARALSRRKSVLVKGQGVVTFGTVSPEQAFVFFSSVCFATFVKFFSDYLTHRRAGTVTTREEEVFQKAVASLPPVIESPPALQKGPFERREDLLLAMIQAGRATVECGLVDSYFGNISALSKETLFISQTGSSLDELEGLIDPVPLDSSSCAGVTASSELSAHREVYLRGGGGTILHGHPKFSVILSMLCEGRALCERDGQCHRACKMERWAGGLPIVPGEVGTGPFGLARTLPAALLQNPGAIVYGHGVFTRGSEDFNAPFRLLLETENRLRATYFDLVQ